MAVLPRPASPRPASEAASKHLKVPTLAIALALALALALIPALAPALVPALAFPSPS